MKKTLSLTFLLLLALIGWVSAHSQSSTARKDYKVVSHDYILESGKKVLIYNYTFKGSTIKTREKYFNDREEQDEELSAATKHYTGCGPQLDIFSNIGIKMGRKIVCEDNQSKTYIIVYSHFDSLNKVNLISGKSRRIVEEFVKGICPYAYHLYPDIECPEAH